MGLPPLVITGMHRSGTSATARLLQRAGLDIGDRLLGPALDNPLGYYEDLDFCALNLDLVAAGVADPGLQPDWAFPDRMVPERLEPLRARAEALVADRSERGHAWGWKDPRTSLLLDFYDAVAPDARYLFVYRAPWEVVTSLLAAHDQAFRGRADLAVRAWTGYNARLLAFRDRHPQRTSLVHLDAVAGRPDDVLARVGRPVLAGEGGFVDRLRTRTERWSALAELLSADHPDAAELYARLDDAADLPGPDRLGDDDGDDDAWSVEVEPLHGGLPAAAVLVGAPADGVEAATRVARPSAGPAPGVRADHAMVQLPDDLVAVLFAGQLRPAALRIAVAALQDDPGLGAVLLAPGGRPQPALAHDPLRVAEAGAGVLVRRSTWLATRGFAAVQAPAGYEGWSFAVACVAAGLPVARVDGALHLPGAQRDGAGVRRRVLLAHPQLAVDHALDAEREADRRTEQAEWEAAGSREREIAAGGREQAAAEVALAAGLRAHQADRRAGAAEALAEAAGERARAAEARALAAEVANGDVAARLAQLQASRAVRYADRWTRRRSR